MPPAAAAPEPRHRAKKARGLGMSQVEDPTMSATCAPDPGRVPKATVQATQAVAKAKPEEPRSSALERLGPWSSSGYLTLAKANLSFPQLTPSQHFVLGLILARADSSGRVQFARRDLVRLYGIEPDSVDDRPFQQALDQLIRVGWLKVERRTSGSNRANFYQLALPPNPEALPLQRDLHVPLWPHPLSRSSPEWVAARRSVQAAMERALKQSKSTKPKIKRVRL